MSDNRAAVERVCVVLRQLSDMLPGKVRAYGAAHELQPRLLALLMERYQADDGSYVVPAHIMAEVPRVTRVLDRVIRIMNTPASGDIHGEAAWLDAAGDAVAGAARALAVTEADARLRGAG
jgi:hypothetical protein